MLFYYLYDSYMSCQQYYSMIIYRYKFTENERCLIWQI
nr:MAG TPA: hypothetical protein [Caudoviricetes sp.]